MTLQLIFQTILQSLVSFILVPWSILYWIASLIFRSGNAVKNPKVVLISGASSGLGRSLAIAYSKPGVIVGLLGRSRSRLQEVHDICTQKGATPKILVVDVLDSKEMERLLSEFQVNHPIDILIANAGVSSGTVDSANENDAFHQVFQTNTTGVINTVLPLLKSFQRRKSGQIVIMGSLAGNLGSVSPSVPYCASKAAVESLSYSWRKQCKPLGVGVTLITPGFVKTPLTDKNDFSMPLIMGSDEATDIMIDGISHDRALVAYPSTIFLTSWLVKIIPVDLISSITNFIQDP